MVEQFVRVTISFIVYHIEATVSQLTHTHTYPTSDTHTHTHHTGAHYHWPVFVYIHVLYPIDVHVTV